MEAEGLVIKQEPYQARGAVCVPVKAWSRLHAVCPANRGQGLTGREAWDGRFRTALHS